MPCFVIGPGSGDERTALLARLAEQLGYPTSIVPNLDAVRADPGFIAAPRPLVLVPDVSPGGPLAEAALRFAQAEGGRASVVYIADTIAPDIYKQLVRSHAGEWITWGAMPDELRDFVRHLSSPESSDRTAKVLSCLPSKGGVGNTLLALEIAVQLAGRRKRAGSRVAILDLDMTGGTLADSLDLEPRLDIREIMERPERLDEQLIDVFTSRYSPQLDVFASPVGRELGPIDPQAVFALLDGISARYDLIVLDVPHGGFDGIDNLLRGSDAVVVSGGSTVPALKQLVARLDGLDRLPVAAERVAVAVNPCEADLLGRISRRADIERPLASRRAFYIREDAATVRGALNAGRPVMELSPNTRVARDIAKLAQWVEGVTDRPQSPARDGGMTRGRVP